MDASLSVPLSHNLTVMSTVPLAETQGEALQEWFHNVHASCRRLAELKARRLSDCRGSLRAPSRCNGRKPSRSYTGMQMPVQHARATSHGCALLCT